MAWKPFSVQSSLSMASFKMCLILFTLFLTSTTIIGTVNAQEVISTGQLCDNSHGLDLGPLHDSVWKLSNTKHDEFFDILACGVFDDKHLMPSAECKGSTICQKTTDGKYIGLNPIHVEKFEKNPAWRVLYMGPKCEENLNYTVEIKFFCGDHLGYPVYPQSRIISKCKTILHWETVSVCPTESRRNKPYEHQCYVIDDDGSRRDLTPLMKSMDEYKVQAPHKDIRINVCSEAKTCGDHMAACIVDAKDKTPIGSSMFHTLSYVPKKDNHGRFDYIELSYKIKNAACLNVGSSQNDSLAITTVRFICPKSLNGVPALKRHPVLVSDLECRYEIDWITEHACPQEHIKEAGSTCSFNKLGLDLSGLGQPNDIVIDSGANKIFVNLCDNIKNEICGSKNSICVVRNNKTELIHTVSQKSSNLVKTDGGYLLEYSEPNKCSVSGQSQEYLFKLECGPDVGRPELVAADECSYEFVWKTKLVCDKYREPLDCQFTKNGTIYDLSSLTGTAGSVTQMFKVGSPRSFYAFKEFYLNICGPIGRIDKDYDCGMASACIIDRKNKKVKSMGMFDRDFIFDDSSSSIRLIYGSGDSNSTTDIRFFCTRQMQRSEAYGYSIMQNGDKFDAKVIFKSSAACPLEEINGQNCQINVPGVGMVDLKPLKADKYYTVPHGNYDYLLNVCGPVVEPTCVPDTAICQKEKKGAQRTFSLGQYGSSSVKYWNDRVNVTFVNGSPYNDAKKTPRKSHITFICDPNAGRGEPEFTTEKDQGYHFEWYTAIVCPVKNIEPFDCSWHNDTHYFDLNPLQMSIGNHYSVEEQGRILYMNFCRGLNPLRIKKDNCRSDNGACLLKFHEKDPKMVLNLGRPVFAPATSFDGSSYLLLKDGDPCPANPKFNISTYIQLKCARDVVDRQLDIQLFEPLVNNSLSMNDIDEHSCNYNIVVTSKHACVNKFEDVKFDKCVYHDPRTKMVINLNDLNKGVDVSVQNKSSRFLLDVCGNVTFPEDTVGFCKNSAVCYKDANGTFINYGVQKDPKVYFEGKNFHVRFTSDTQCHEGGGFNWADIEFQCDPGAHSSKPTLMFRDKCASKFVWKTSLVCHLGAATCSLLDLDSRSLYSLAPLSMKSNLWSVKNNAEEVYLLNVCQPVSPSKCSGIVGAAACKCQKTFKNSTLCHNIGQLSDHELMLDPISKELVLRYEDGDRFCKGSVASTQINFRCSREQTGFAGPRFVNMSDCDHYFIWDTTFACPINFDADEITYDSKTKTVKDNRKLVYWDFSKMFDGTISITEHRNFTNKSLNETYVYKFAFSGNDPDFVGNCKDAAICQTKPDGFKRNIGSLDSSKWSLEYFGKNILIKMPSSTSKCGTSKDSNQFVSTKVSIECTFGADEIEFIYENHDCEYYFVWKTNQICDATAMALAPSNQPDDRKGGLGFLWTMVSLFICISVIFVVWITVSQSKTRDDVVFNIRKVFRRKEQDETPFRYQQSEDEGILLTAQV